MTDVGKSTRSPLDPFEQWFFPKLVPFVPTWMSPNAISAIGISFALAAAALLWWVDISRWFYVASAVLLLLTWVTDTLDGMVARARQQTSRLGYYLDHFGDAVAGLAMGISMFAAGGSHFEIGLVCTALLLLLHVNAHIKVATFGRIELPAFGPTETRLLVVGVLVCQAFIGGPGPGDGWPVDALGFEATLTLIDLVGILSCSVYTLLIPLEVASNIRRLAQMDALGSG